MNENIGLTAKCNGYMLSAYSNEVNITLHGESKRESRV